jgi:hypothetical protein
LPGPSGKYVSWICLTLCPCPDTLPRTSRYKKLKTVWPSIKHIKHLISLIQFSWHPSSSTDLEQNNPRNFTDNMWHTFDPLNRLLHFKSADSAEGNWISMACLPTLRVQALRTYKKRSYSSHTIRPLYFCNIML